MKPHDTTVKGEGAVKRSRKRHVEADAWFRSMAETVDDVFWISASAGRELLYVSPAYERIWDRPLAELYANPRQWVDAVVPEDKAGVLEAREQLAGGKEYRIEYRIRRRDGTLRWIDDRSYPIREPAGELNRAVGVARDITPRKQLEAQLLHSQKMEAVGELAGGIAHDFNNVLTVVTGYARLLLDGGMMPPDAVEGLTQIYTAGARATNLTRQLLLFSRKQTANCRVVDFNRIVDEIAQILHRLIGEHIGLKLQLSSAPAWIEADPGMMEQVLMNLAVNARDAMTNGGALTIGTETVRIDDARSRHHPEARSGEFVVLSVRDTGCGIPPENLQRIFEPFFTTKDAGRGTGLGLATVFGIVKQHQGWIEVESTVGAGTGANQILSERVSEDMGGTPMPRGTGVPPVGLSDRSKSDLRPAGTCFRVLLPASPKEAPIIAGGAVNAPAVQSGSETMLLVEDEPSVREFAVAVLRGHGYRVLQAGSGAEALEVWRCHATRIVLLFTDLVLPEGLGGVELAATLRKEKPTLKVVLTSGYVDETIDDAFRPPPGTHFIHKPYKPQVLAQAVRDALDDNFNR